MAYHMRLLLVVFIPVFFVDTTSNCSTFTLAYCCTVLAKPRPKTLETFCFTYSTNLRWFFADHDFSRSTFFQH
jgi:hypothetical protein